MKTAGERFKEKNGHTFVGGKRAPCKNHGSVRDLPPGNLHGITPAAKLLFEKIAMIPLDLDNTILYGSTGTASFFQLFREREETFVVERNTPDGGDHPPLPAFLFPPYPHDSVRLRDNGFFTAFAPAGGSPAFRTDPAVLRRINDADLVSLFR